jgi:hypothetical protein
LRDLNIDFSQTDSQQTHSFRLSVLAVGCGIWLFVSLLLLTGVPGSKPFGAEHWMWLAGGTVFLGAVALVRRERGYLALASAMMTVAVVGLLLAWALIGAGSVLMMRLFMPD